MDNDNIICSDGSIITDNIICECSYNLNKEVEHRWIPERIRPDKTAPNAVSYSKYCMDVN